MTNRIDKNSRDIYAFGPAAVQAQRDAKKPRGKLVWVDAEVADERQTVVVKINEPETEPK